MFIGTGIGAGLSLLATPGTANAASPIPKLAYESSRVTTATPRGVPYDYITVSYNGAKAALFVPHTAIPKKTTVAVAWYYHANGSTHTALNSAYKYSAELLVDKGVVCYCPNFAKTGTTEFLWVNQTALTRHANAVTYLKSQFKIGMSFMRANSGGGSLMCWAYGKNLVPAARGMYMANASYNMEDLFARDPARVGPAYNNSLSAVKATNPSRLPASAWANKRMRVIVSDAAHPDVVLPPATHGLALVKLAKPVATEASVKYHTGGHVIPSFANKDMVDTFVRWGG